MVRKIQNIIYVKASQKDLFLFSFIIENDARQFIHSTFIEVIKKKFFLVVPHDMRYSIC